MNKKLFFAAIAFAGMASGVLTACGDKDEFKEVAVSPVQQLYEPAADKYITLQLTGGTYFEWERATAADNGVVYYQVLFDKKGGDFKNPIYVLTADNYGTSNGATITHRVLNRIGKYAGIESGQEGEISWTVRSNRGLTFTMGKESRNIKIVRLSGVDSPDGADLLITGEGAEADQKFKALSEVQFEIYTKLEAGKPYYFYSVLNDNIRMFRPEEDGTFRETATTPDDVTVAETGVYRIKLDFDVPSVKIERVNDIQLYVFFSRRSVPLTYQAKGVWTLTNYDIIMPATTWPHDPYDSRYIFIFTVDGVQERWNRSGSFSNDLRPELGLAGYGDIHFATYESEQWSGDGSPFRFPAGATNPPDQWYVDVTLSLTADGNYTHAMTNLHQ